MCGVLKDGAVAGVQETTTFSVKDDTLVSYCCCNKLHLSGENNTNVLSYSPGGESLERASLG